MRILSVVTVLLICLGFIVSGCKPEDDPMPYQSNPILENVDTSPRTLTGQTTGTANAVYTLSEAKVVCSDEAATYEMTLSKDNQTPSDTLLTNKLPDKTQYFSIDVNAVMRILDKGKCLVRDDSDDRVHLRIEGYFEGANYKFTPLSCSKTSSISNAEIYFSSDYVVKGNMECDYSEQMKYTFQFADLKLK